MHMCKPENRYKSRVIYRKTLPIDAERKPTMMVLLANAGFKFSFIFIEIKLKLCKINTQ